MGANVWRHAASLGAVHGGVRDAAVFLVAEERRDLYSLRQPAAAAGVSS